MAAIILIRVRSLLPPPAPEDGVASVVASVVTSVVTVSVVSVTLSSMVGMMLFRIRE